MAAALQADQLRSMPDALTPVVVVGSGPVGCRAVEELLRRNSKQAIVHYGAEAIEPYNRVRLSSFLAGEIDYAALLTSDSSPAAHAVERRLGCEVVAIDRSRQVVRDAYDREQPYSTLILAIGSSPHVPHIANIKLAGVFTFRDFNDAQQLFARRMRSRRTVVLGAGLLGLEAARAMRRFNTEVIVVEHAPRALPRLLDEAGSALLAEHLAALGIRVKLNVSVRSLEGVDRVAGVLLSNGERIECDTVIVATGIRPNIELARNAGLSVGRGIRVDDTLRTSDPNIFAVGECVEHREVVYGLVGPGIEQASVAAAVIAGQPARYAGSTLATKLKVVGKPVFAVGKTVDEDYGRDAREHVYKNGGVYRKLIVERGRLIGAVAIDDTPEMGRLQESVTHRRRVYAWHLLRFKRTGLLWPTQQSVSVVQWPAAATVCQCTGVTRAQLTAAIASGCKSVPDLAACTGASTVCGSCKPLLAELAGAKAEPIDGAQWLWATAIVAAICAVLFASLPSIPYVNSIASGARWDLIWRDTFLKQMSGYVILTLAVIASALSLRKRIKRISFGKFANWRVVHTCIGIAALLALLVHTGGRLGDNLNLYLMACFLGLLAVGAGSAATMAIEHHRPVATQKRRWLWAHILFTWPLPVLLGWHVFKSYYF